MLPKKFNYLGYKAAIKRSGMDERTIPLDEKFNIFTHHSRYDRKTAEFLHPDAVKVTILRNPAALFESLYNYYNLQKVYNVSFSQLLSSLPRNSKFSVKKNQRVQGHNQMSRDLGLESEFYYNEMAIENFIRSIDSEFDLVMIQEYLEASLVLLANLMGWPLNYVSFIGLNARNTAKKYNLTDSEMIKLSRFNGADSKLYDHFLKKFRQCLINYGRERIIGDVQKLHDLNQNLRRRCVLRENLNGYAKTVTYVLRDESDWMCTYSTKSELKFTEELRAAQSSRMESVRKLQKFIYTE